MIVWITPENKAFLRKEYNMLLKHREIVKKRFISPQTQYQYSSYNRKAHYLMCQHRKFGIIGSMQLSFLKGETWLCHNLFFETLHSPKTQAGHRERQSLLLFFCEMMYESLLNVAASKDIQELVFEINSTTKENLRHISHIWPVEYILKIPSGLNKKLKSNCKLLRVHLDRDSYSQFIQSREKRNFKIHGKILGPINYRLSA